MELELRQIKELMAAMGRTGMKRLELGEGEFKLVLEREGVESIRIIDRAQEEPFHRNADEALFRGGDRTTTPPTPFKSSVDEPARVSEPGQVVKSPMVGTFYSSPSPDHPPFVKVGDYVKEGSVLCIIEAMKVMNEIKAGVSGRISEVLVENSHPVEFGTPLYRVIKD